MLQAEQDIARHRGDKGGGVGGAQYADQGVPAALLYRVLSVICPVEILVENAVTGQPDDGVARGEHIGSSGQCTAQSRTRVA